SLLAQHTHSCQFDAAWSAGLLAPLGWLAACAGDPVQTGASLNRVDSTNGDPCSIARRLTRRWRLPRWLSVVIGHLNLSVETAQMLGADAGLFRTVQVAVAWAQANGHGLHFPLGAEWPDLAAGLSIDPGII